MAPFASIKGREISIHAPLTGSDLGPNGRRSSFRHFNPRSPYGERLQIVRRLAQLSDFNPRSPYGERPRAFHFAYPIFDFNPRSPYGERLSFLQPLPSSGLFQSTLPLRGATANSDGADQRQCDFNPRSPYGERPRYNIHQIHLQQFQSTLPLRGATQPPENTDTAAQISIHAPLTGSDRGCPCFLEVIMISIHAPLTGSD